MLSFGAVFQYSFSLLKERARDFNPHYMRATEKEQCRGGDE
jgi:hypothetical protein